LTALAAVVREGRTLFLIDEPGRLAGRVALLTFAFPASMRAALTFSTYHDRPEELPGFRIQGTAPEARPNRAVLVGLGIVADLTTGAFEPSVEPAPWALTLAGWLTQGGKDDELAWIKTETRAGRALPPDSSGSVWSDAWLDRLIAFHEGCKVPAPLPKDAGGWTRLADLADWSGRAALADEWLIRGPSWWKEAAGSAGLPEARAALVAHGSLREAWAGPKGLAPAWGETVAAWFASTSADERFSAALSFLRAAPGSSRLPWLHAFLQAMPDPVAAETLDRFKTGRSLDPTLLLPMEVRAAVASVVNGTGEANLRDVLTRAFDAPNTLKAVLDALGAEANAQPSAVGSLAPVLADALDATHEFARDLVRSWTLRRVDAETWLAPHLRRLFASPDLIDAWRTLRDRTSNDLQPVLACAVLAVAQDPTVSGEAFRWGVDELLLRIDEPRRPRDPDWPNIYLSRVSGLELVHALFSKGRRQPEVRRWLESAKTRGELSAEGLARLDRCRNYVHALNSGQAESLLGLTLPDVYPREQGTLLAQLVAYLGNSSTDGLFLCLDACRNAWPDAFQPGTPGLDRLARPLADALKLDQPDPELWFTQLTALLTRLDPIGEDLANLGPEGLIAEIVAATTQQLGEPGNPWALRQFLFRRDDAWRTLAIDARIALRASDGEHGAAALEHWDSHVDKGTLTGRFYELMLNSCDGPTLAAVATNPGVIANLSTIGPLSWWTWNRHPGATDDLRDAFARLAPMAPLEAESLQPLRAWMGRADRREPLPRAMEVESLDLALLEGDEPSQVPVARPAPGPLSALGQARWRCLDALSAFHRDGLDPEARWQAARRWEDEALPLSLLDLEDRQRFLAWTVHGLSELDDAPLERLACWFVQMGVTDADRLADWALELSSQIEVPQTLRAERARLVADLSRAMRLRVQELRAKPSRQR
jgi:hypothetical protein